MARLRPGLSSYARISYARELLGDVAGAIEAMKLARRRRRRRRARPRPGRTSSSASSTGRRAHRAGAARRTAPPLRVFPGYAYGLDALARVEAARGHIAAAIALEQAGGRPDPAAAVRRRCSATSTASTGQPALARAAVRADRRDRAAARRERRPDRPRDALFDVDHGIRLPARARARAHGAARSARRSTATTSSPGRSRATAAAARRSRYSQARPPARHAATRSSSSTAAMIERCLGHRAAARSWFRRALALNPHFSILWAPVARR